MTIYHFAKTLEAIRKSGFIDCPTFKASIDHQHLRTADKLFGQWFPDFLRIRHAVAHAAELDKDLKSRARNAVGILTLRNTFSGSKFYNSFDGRACSYEMLPKTLSNLKRVREVASKSFSRIDFMHRPPAP